MKNRRLQFEYRKNASTLHRVVGNCLRDSKLFSGYKVYQEYPVNKIDLTFPSGREKYDWVILDLNLIIECHGKQHYEPVAFDGNIEEAEYRYKMQIYKDRLKEEAAVKANFIYIVIPYTDKSKVSEEYILGLIKKARDITLEGQLVQDESNQTKGNYKEQYRARKQYLEDKGILQAQRAKAKQVRKEQYKRAKEWLDKVKEEDKKNA